MVLYLPEGTTTVWLALREQCALAKTLTLVAMVPPSPPPRPDGPVVISLATLVPANDPRIQVYSGAQGDEVLCSQLQTGLYHPHFQPTRSERRNAVLITS